MSPNRVHPTAIVGEGVELGDDNVIGPYTVLLGPCRIGNGNRIGPHACIGGPAEYRGGPHPAAWGGECEGAGTEIGNRNVIREFVTINQGIHRPTALGNDGYLMGRAHVGHDSVLGDLVTLTSAVQIAGHCEIWSLANLGLGSLVHQFVRVGPGAMVGMGSVVRKEVGAFMVTVGNPARTVGVNAIGLSRQGCDDGQITAIEEHLKGLLAVPGNLPETVGVLLGRWSERAEYVGE